MSARASANAGVAACTRTSASAGHWPHPAVAKLPCAPEASA
ncbi:MULTISPECIES: hypothetical protein [Amycolatopsis]|nr:hypothetical protein [Amycolatopsis bullii]